MYYKVHSNITLLIIIFLILDLNSKHLILYNLNTLYISYSFGGFYFCHYLSLAWSFSSFFFHFSTKSNIVKVKTQNSRFRFWHFILVFSSLMTIGLDLAKLDSCFNWDQFYVAVLCWSQYLEEILVSLVLAYLCPIIPPIVIESEFWLRYLKYNEISI